MGWANNSVVFILGVLILGVLLGTAFLIGEHWFGVIFGESFEDSDGKPEKAPLLERFDKFVTSHLGKIVVALLSAGILLNVYFGFSIFY